METAQTPTLTLTVAGHVQGLPRAATLTFLVPLSLRLRIDQAAAAARRSRSQYLVLLLEKSTPA
jgi:hypothetical protein